MRRRRITAIAVLFFLEGSSSALGSSGQFALNELAAASERINSFKRAYALLNSETSSSFADTFAAPEINFARSTDFPSASSDSNMSHGFAVGISGQVEIPSAGVYSLAIRTRNHVLLDIDGQMLRSSDRTQVKPITFTQAGLYSISIADFGARQPSELKVYASPGKYHTFHARRADFQLIGDTVNGGLAVTSGSSDENNGSGQTMGAGQTTGDSSPIVVVSGGTISVGSDGTTTGLLSTGAQEWDGGSTYVWKINNVAGTPGTSDGWDKVSMSALSVSASAGNPVTIAPQSFDGSSPGTPAGISGSGGTYSWVIAHSDSQVSINQTPQAPENLVNTGAFALDTSNFKVDGSSVPQSDFQLDLVVNGNGDDLVLTYNAAPEPGEVMLAGVGMCPLLLTRRRYKQAA
jgi:hypothetical protein